MKFEDLERACSKQGNTCVTCENYKPSTCGFKCEITQESVSFDDDACDNYYPDKIWEPKVKILRIYNCEECKHCCTLTRHERIGYFCKQYGRSIPDRYTKVNDFPDWCLL